MFLFEKCIKSIPGIFLDEIPNPQFLYRLGVPGIFEVVNTKLIVIAVGFEPTRPKPSEPYSDPLTTRANNLLTEN